MMEYSCIVLVFICALLFLAGKDWRQKEKGDVEDEMVR